MTAELLSGFMVYVDGMMVAHAETFESAKAIAQDHTATSSSTASVQILTASSQVVRGVGASPVRTWNYDRKLNARVEFVR